MRRTTIVRTASIGLLAAAALGACTTTGLADFARAANELDPHCAKHVEATVTPNFIFGWPVPLLSGKYVKDCQHAPFPTVTPGAAILPASPEDLPPPVF